MISDEQREASRKDFELSLIFNEYKLLSGQGGELVKNEDGTYANHFIEAAWRGFQMAIGNAEGMLERFDPTRYIGPGLIGAFREASDYEWGTTEEDTLYIHDEIRAALKACGDTPA